MNLYYINLDSRTERKELMQKNWGEIVDLIRVPGVKIEAEKFGAKGCFLAHKEAFRQIEDSEDFGGAIGEDDIIPTSNFREKLWGCAEDIPKDWDLLMVGFNVSIRSKFTKITERISKANEHITAGHCYIINPSFYETWAKELENPANCQNLDVLLLNIQVKHNVYMCNPTLCYQYESYSDNSNRIVGNTQSTKTYFKE